MNICLAAYNKKEFKGSKNKCKDLIAINTQHLSRLIVCLKFQYLKEN